MPKIVRAADPVWSNDSTNPREARLAHEGLLTRVDTGVLRGGILAGPNPVRAAATPSGTAPTTRVDPCHVVIPRAGQGAWLVAVEATTVVDHDVSSSTGARTDLVVARVYDTEVGDTIPAAVAPAVTTPTQKAVAVVEVITGTVGAGAPALPAGAALLRQVTLPAGANTLPTYTGLPGPVCVLRGGLVPCATQGEQDSLSAYSGLLVLRTDTGNVELRWDSRWHRIASLSGRTTWTPALLAGGAAVGLGTGGSSAGRAHIIGREMDATWFVQLGTGGVDGKSGTLTLTLPAGVTSANSYQCVPCKIYVPNQARHYIGVLEFPPSSTTGTIIMPSAFNDASARPARNTDPVTPTTPGTGIPKIDAAAGGPDYVLQNNGSIYAAGRMEIA